MKLTKAILQKSSFTDYPGELSMVVYTPGCNFRCKYCHNPDLVINPFENDALMDIEEIYELIRNAHSMIKHIVITGGEPLIYDNIQELIDVSIDCGLNVKLNTNGQEVTRLKELKHLSFISMDFKGEKVDYDKYKCKSYENVLESLEYIQDTFDEYEINTVVDTDLITKENISSMKEYITDYSKWNLIRCNNKHTLTDRSDRPNVSDEYINELQTIIDGE